MITEETKTELQRLLTEGGQRYKVPSHTVDGLVRFYCKGCPPGDFLKAVLNNDLKDAMGRADEVNRHSMFEIMCLLYNVAPLGTWGHPGAVKDWLESFHAPADDPQAENTNEGV